MWDEFSEYLLENRFPTSADFNTYPIRIFSLRSDSIVGQPWVLFLVDPLCPKFIDNHLSRSCHSPVLFFNAEHDSVPCPDVLTGPS